MRGYSLSRLSNFELTRGLASLVAQDRITTAQLLAHVAEFDARRLYVPAAYPSMFAYCIGELKLSEDSAYKRIRVARAARKCPAIFDAISDGRLNLAAIVLLAPHLTSANARGLLAAASRKTKSEIEELIASRFPSTESLELVEALPAAFTGQLAPGPVEVLSPCGLGVSGGALAQERVHLHGFDSGPPAMHPIAPKQLAPRSDVKPIAVDRFLLQLNVSRSTREKLEHARNLLGHQLPSGDLAGVLDRALDALIEKLERRKFAATRRPRLAPRANRGTRHVPAHVKRAAWERDGGQCTFVSESGRRCSTRKCLEFDHIVPVARSGEATPAGIRLRCRAHNQYAAECVFGAGFMRAKRESARRTAEARPAAATPRRATACRHPERDAPIEERTSAIRASEPREQVVAQELVAPLRTLGFSADEARRAVMHCRSVPDETIELRVRRALSFLCPPRRPIAARLIQPADGC